jgi:hypothetical protein
MIRRKLKGNPGCYFCTDLETYEHLFFECQLEEWSGVSLLYASNRMSGHDLMNNSGHRSKLLFLEGRTFTCLVLLLFAGVFGSSGTECVFKRNLLGTPVKSFAPCVRSCVIGQIRWRLNQKAITVGVDLMMQTVLQLLVKKEVPIPALMDKEDEVEDAPIEPDEPMN